MEGGGKRKRGEQGRLRRNCTQRHSTQEKQPRATHKLAGRSRGRYLDDPAKPANEASGHVESGLKRRTLSRTRHACV